MANDSNLKPFRKGDKRINRKGRPKDFPGLRDLAQQIAHDALPNGMTVAEAMLKQWAGSKDARLQIAFMEYAFGKVPAPVEMAGKDGGKLEIVVTRGKDRNRLNSPASGTDTSTEPGETVQRLINGPTLGQDDFGD